MNRKKIFTFVLTGLLLLVILCYVLSIRHTSPERAVLSDFRQLSFDDVKKFRKTISFDDPNVRDYFSLRVATPYTVGYFKSLQMHFQEEKTQEEHLSAIYQYLLSVFPREKADMLFALYRKFIQYEIDITTEYQGKKSPSSVEDILATLGEIQNYRRSYFGEEAADAMFGAEVKNQEYLIKKGDIINNSGLHGNEKEERIRALSQDFWGNEAAEAATYEYNSSVKCDEKMAIYKKDLDEMTPEQRQLEIRHIREDFFPPDIVDNLEKLDRKLDMEKKNETEYREKEKAVMADPSLSPEEKDRKLEDMQKNIFGEDADIFRKKEDVRKALGGQ